MKNTFVLCILFLGFIFGCQSSAGNQQEVKNNMTETNKMIRTATFAGGCFWCLEAVFDEIKGI